MSIALMEEEMPRSVSEETKARTRIQNLLAVEEIWIPKKLSTTGKAQGWFTKDLNEAFESVGGYASFDQSLSDDELLKEVYKFLLKWGGERVRTVTYKNSASTRKINDLLKIVTQLSDAIEESVNLQKLTDYQNSEILGGLSIIYKAYQKTGASPINVIDNLLSKFKIV